MKPFKVIIHLMISTFILTSLHAEQSATPNLKYDLEIPILGPASLQGTVDLLKEEFALKGTLVSPRAQIDLGPLVFDKPSITLSNTHGLSLKTHGKFFDQIVELGVKELKSKTKIILGITFFNKPTLTITPQHTLALSELDLILEKEKPPIISTILEIFSRPVVISFGTNSKNDTVEFDVPSLSITDFDSSLANSPFKDLTFSNLHCTLNNLFHPQDETKPRLEFKGTINCSSLALPTVTSETTQLAVQGQYDVTNGLILKITLNEIPVIPAVGKINNASLLFMSKQPKKLPAFVDNLDKFPYLLPPEPSPTQPVAGETPENQPPKLAINGPTLLLYGRSTITLPHIGPVEVEITSRIGKDAFNFVGKILNDLNVGPIKITNPEISFSPQAFSFKIFGECTFRDINFLTQIDIGFDQSKTGANIPPVAGSAERNYHLKLKGTAKPQTAYQPFKNVTFLNIPHNDHTFINSITLNELTIGIDLSSAKTTAFEDDIYIEGMATIFNTPLRAHLSAGVTSNGDKGIIFKAQLPEHWKLSNIHSGLSVFDTIDFSNASLFISSIKYIEQWSSIAKEGTHGATTPGGATFLTLDPGISLYTEIDPAKAIKNINKIMSINAEKIGLYGALSTSGNFKLAASLPNLLIFNSKIIKSLGLALVLGAGVEAQLPYVALQTELTIQPTPQDEILKFVAKIQLDELEGKIAGTMAGMWDHPFGIPGFSIGNLAVQVDLNYVQLATTGLPSGIGLAGSMQFGSDQDPTNISMACHVTEDEKDLLLYGKINGTLSLKKVLEAITHTAIISTKKSISDPFLADRVSKELEEKFNKIYNSEGLKQILEIGLKNSEIRMAPTTTTIGQFTYPRGVTLSGDLEFLGKTAHVISNLDLSGLILEGSLPTITVGELFSFTGAGLDKKYGTADDGPILSIALSLEKQGFLLSGLLKFLGLQQQVDFSLDKDGLYTLVEGKIFNLFDSTFMMRSQGNLKDPDLIFKAATKNDFFSFLATNAKKSIEDAFNDAQSKLQIPKKNLDEINQAIYFLNRAEEAKKAELKKVNSTPLEGFKHTDQLIKLGFEIAELELTKGTLIIGKKIAEGTVEAIKKTLGGLGDAATSLVSLPEKVLDIQEATFEGSVKDIVHGVLPHLKLTVRLFNKLSKLDLALDFSSRQKAEESAKQVGRELLKLF